MHTLEQMCRHLEAGHVAVPSHYYHRQSHLLPGVLLHYLDVALRVATSRTNVEAAGARPGPRPILAAAAASGITVVRTYGMSETAGGCVYDGVPLDGVSVRVDPDGRIMIGGATLAKGCRNPIDPNPFAEPGWFRTDD